jgi:MFS family permease
MPFVGAYITELGGTDVQVAAVVLVAQAVMIPVALLTSWLCDRWGRKPAFAIFLALPLRIFLYTFTRDPWGLVALQALDGIGAGVYGVAVVAMGADLTRGKGRFNALQGMLANAQAVGGVAWPLGAGWLAEHLGYNAFFCTFAGIAAVAAALFLLGMPETCPANVEKSEGGARTPDVVSYPSFRAAPSDGGDR